MQQMTNVRTATLYFPTKEVRYIEYGLDGVSRIRLIEGGGGDFDAIEYIRNGETTLVGGIPFEITRFKEKNNEILP
jgi:hypothetical protein